MATNILQCGYCKEPSIAWIEWKTIGRPKGAPVCLTHLNKKNVADNFGDYPTIKWNVYDVQLSWADIMVIREGIARDRSAIKALAEVTEMTPGMAAELKTINELEERMNEWMP